MGTLDLTDRIGAWLGWLGGNWVALLAIVLSLVFLYVFAALMLDLPMPFENRGGGGTRK